VSESIIPIRTCTVCHALYQGWHLCVPTPRLCPTCGKPREIHPCYCSSSFHMTRAAEWDEGYADKLLSEAVERATRELREKLRLANVDAFEEGLLAATWENRAAWWKAAAKRGKDARDLSPSLWSLLEMRSDEVLTLRADLARVTAERDRLLATMQEMALSLHSDSNGWFVYLEAMKAMKRGVLEGQ
jgi:hypothetical protein